MLNYTTKIDPAKTIGEIGQCLAKHGARKIITDYDETGQPTGLTFHLLLSGQLVVFALPCNWPGVLAAMKRDAKIPRSACTEAQANRTGWRNLKVWIEAQLSIIEAGLVTPTEVFLPYVVMKDGQTLHKHIEGNTQLLLN